MLDLETPIVSRLEAALGDSARVLTATSLQQLQDGRMAMAPAVFVLYLRGTPSLADAWELVQIRQRWWAVVMARHADATGRGARGSAGVLARQVFDALAGWTPEGASRPLLLADMPRADYLSGGVLLPLEFETEIELTMAPGE